MTHLLVRRSISTVEQSFILIKYCLSIAFKQIKKLTAENSIADQMTEDENEEIIEEWSHEELVKRSQQLQLLDENGHCVLPHDNRRSDGTSTTGPLFSDDGKIEGFDDDSGKSASTTSDSQVSSFRNTNSM